MYCVAYTRGSGESRHPVQTRSRRLDVDVDGGAPILSGNGEVDVRAFGVEDEFDLARGS
jgi:hypothetical protein